MMVAINSIAQVKTPEYEGQVAVVNNDSTTTVLKKEAATIKAKSGGLGMIPMVGGLVDKTKSFLIIKGESSKTMLPAGRLTFVVNVGGNNKEPRNAFGILKLELKKKNRQYQMGEFSLLGGSKSDMDFCNVTYEAKKYGTDCYLVVIENAEPGQYAFFTGNMSALLTFGVK